MAMATVCALQQFDASEKTICATNNTTDTQQYAPFNNTYLSGEGFLIQYWHWHWTDPYDRCQHHHHHHRDHLAHKLRWREFAIIALGTRVPERAHKDAHFVWKRFSMAQKRACCKIEQWSFCKRVDTHTQRYWLFLLSYWCDKLHPAIAKEQWGLALSSVSF